MKTRKNGQFEYRLICNDPRHKLHRYGAGDDRTKAQGRADKANADPVCDPATCIPWHRGCRPWRIEGRYVSEWTDDLDRLELRTARVEPAANLFDFGAVA